MNEKMSDGKMGLVVERVYTCLCWIFFILGLFSKVSNCFLSFSVMLHI